MTLKETILIATGALRLNATRSFLTMLGIIIGIAAVIVMVSISEGAKKQVEDSINQLGTNQLMVRPGASFFGGRSSGAGTATPITEKDMNGVMERLPFIEGGSGSVGSNTPVVLGNKNWQSQITGVHDSYFNVRELKVAEGRAFNAQEVRAAGKVAVIGVTIIKNLYDGANPIGTRLRIKNVPFQVIGVLEEKGQNSWGRDQDDVIMIPITTARLRISGRAQRTTPDDIGTMYLKIESGTDLTMAQAEIENELRILRKLAPGAEDDFAVRNMAEFIRARSETMTTLGMLLAATAAIALIVGGIGIMNIMLVSVTERTREIGLRLAVGARQQDILTQFLVEAIALCIIGSIIGVALGMMVTVIIANASDWPVLFSVPVIIGAILSAALVGISFGYYPARKASNLNPIDALRYE
ncbi:MAG: putative ABC transport system permease protein [Lysobacterales bacterium]|jgi:putative ABC transport system permease protein